MPQHTREVLGIDIGYVIIDGYGKGKSSFFGPHFLQTPPMADVFRSIARLKRSRFGGNVFLIAHAESREEARVRRWFDHHKFVERTGISWKNIRFCLERKDKAGICRELGVTHFVDDRLEVLSSLVGVVPNRFLFQGRPNEMGPFRETLPHVRQVATWRQLEAILLGQDAEASA